MIFVADTMLGKLSRWLRILGYDTMYEPAMTPEQLSKLYENQDTVFLTRRTHLPADVVFRNTIYIPYEKFEDQLKYIVKRCGLSTEGPIFTRCLNCNVPIVQISRDNVKERVPRQTYEGTETFYECPKCRNIYWSGTHYNNTIDKIHRIFQIEH